MDIPTDPKLKGDGQHWTTVRELWMRKDKEQCESWKDEVQNILIFSGLFSAIVTAFLIQSQQELKLDQTPINICVNVFWFLSLVLSLTTALVGIVSLQWIRSHMLSMGDGPDCLGLSYMHSLGLRHSYIPRVFTSLPILLILGLTFFLIGIIIFLIKLSWPVAIPVTFVITCTFAFLVITTAVPTLQFSPVKQPSNKPEFFPSPYRSPQSLLFIRQRDWESKSKIWLEERTASFFDGKKLEVRSHLTEAIPWPPFPYDTIKALVSVKQSRSAESEKERTALAKCLAEVLPFYLDLFPIEDLADLIPFLSQSTKYIPSAVFLRQDSATQEDLSAVALLQIATRFGQPSQSPALVAACVRTTHWLFERLHILEPVPEKHPLHLISKPRKSYSLLHLFSHSSDKEEVTPDALEILIDTLTRFFGFAMDFQPEVQMLNKTTHTSSYTYWFLHLSANILIKGTLSEELKARHAYILHIIAVHLDKQKGNEPSYLFQTASIYASTISTSHEMCSSQFGSDFLRAVNGRRRDILGNDSLKLRKAIKANEVNWPNINRALEALSTAQQPLSRSDIQDSTLSEVKDSNGRVGDVDSSGIAAKKAVHVKSTTFCASLEEGRSFDAGPILEVGRVDEGERLAST